MEAFRKIIEAVFPSAPFGVAFGAVLSRLLQILVCGAIGNQNFGSEFLLHDFGNNVGIGGNGHGFTKVTIWNF